MQSRTYASSDNERDVDVEGTASNKLDVNDAQNERDFYNLAKVDTHVHLAAAGTANHLLAFIKKKFITSKDEIVAIDPKTK